MVGVTTHRPTALSGALSVLAGAAAIAVVATGSSQRVALGVTVVALVPLAAGFELARRGHGLAGLLLGVLGTAGVGASVGLGVSSVGSFSNTVELLPGLVGLFVLVLALGPIREGRERALIAAGTGLVLLSVVASAAVYETGTTGLLAAGIGTVLALDLAEQSVNLGEQVGREPKTWGVELVHAGATLGVGILAVLAVRMITTVDVTGVPLTVLAGLLGAGLTLALALYN